MDESEYGKPWENFSKEIVDAILPTSSAFLILPDGVKSIADYAFAQRTVLREVKMPQGLGSIGNYAFYDCQSLKEAMLPDGVKYIGTSAFSHCVGL